MRSRRQGPEENRAGEYGAEAVENAIKIARSYTKRQAILCFEDAFHGRTYMAMAATSKTHPYKAGSSRFRARCTAFLTLTVTAARIR